MAVLDTTPGRCFKMGDGGFLSGRYGCYLHSNGAISGEDFRMTTEALITEVMDVCDGKVSAAPNHSRAIRALAIRLAMAEEEAELKQIEAYHANAKRAEAEAERDAVEWRRVQVASSRDGFKSLLEDERTRVGTLTRRVGELEEQIEWHKTTKQALMDAHEAAIRLIITLRAALREISELKSDKGTYDVEPTERWGWQPRFKVIALAALDLTALQPVGEEKGI